MNAGLNCPGYQLANISFGWYPSLLSKLSTFSRPEETLVKETFVKGNLDIRMIESLYYFQSSCENCQSKKVTPQNE